MATKWIKKNIFIMIVVAFAALCVTPSVRAQAESAPVSEEPKEEKDISEYLGYKGGFYLNDPNGLFSLKINARMQARFTYESIDQADGEEREFETNFSIPAARLKLKGHVFSEKITYAFQTEFGKGNAQLKDFYADFAIKKNVFHLRVGQWVKPFSRQQITSSGKMEFAGRAITDKKFSAGRDIGVAFHNNYSKSPKFEWALGVFNGTGEKPWFESKISTDGESGEVTDVSGKFTNIPDKFNPMLVLRLGANKGKLKGYSEADLEGGPLRLGVGMSGILDFDVDDDKDGNIRAQLDYILKAHGFSSTGGIYVASKQDGASFSEQTYGALGFHAQTGYAIKGMVQPGFRYAYYNPEGGKNYQHEILGGLSLFVFKHNVKWQTEAGAMIYQDGDDSLSDAIIRTQLQLAF